MNVFVSGSRTIGGIGEDITAELSCVLDSAANMLVGDAQGVDTEIQRFCKNQDYHNITVFAMNGKARNNIGDFAVENVVPKDNRNFFEQKDKVMTDMADYGIVIWNGKSKGSLNNIIRLIKQNKPCKVYLTSNKQWIWADEKFIKGELKNENNQ
jgi:hypothetical protein